MRQLCIPMAAVILMISNSLAGAKEPSAKEIKSGLQAGSFIGAFYVTKAAGAEDDGVAVGKNLCYRCRNGGRPQVMVFTRSTDEKVVKLIQSLDSAVAKNSDKQLRVFVNLLGEDKEALTEEAVKLAKTSKTKNVPFVVPNETENGPDNYGINAKADVTIIIAAGGKVTANHASSTSKDLNVEGVLADIASAIK